MRAKAIWASAFVAAVSFASLFGEIVQYWKNIVWGN